MNKQLRCTLIRGDRKGKNGQFFRTLLLRFEDGREIYLFNLQDNARIGLLSELKKHGEEKGSDSSGEDLPF